MTQYAGNSASYPTNYPLVDDSTPPVAAQFNPAFQALGDRTAYLKASAVDGVHGGTYSPSAPIIIPLAQFELTDAGGTPVLFQYAPDVVGVAGLQVSGSITVNGGLTAYGAVLLNSSFTVEGNVVLVGTVQLVNTTLIQGQVSFVSSGRINATKTKNTTAGTNIYANCQIYYNENAFGASSTVNITVHHTTGLPQNPVDGTPLRFVTVVLSLTGVLNLVREDGSTIATIPNGVLSWVDLVFDGATSRWICSAWCSNVTNVSVF